MMIALFASVLVIAASLWCSIGACFKASKAADQATILFCSGAALYVIAELVNKEYKRLSILWMKEQMNIENEDKPQ